MRSVWHSFQSSSNFGNFFSFKKISKFQKRLSVAKSKKNLAPKFNHTGNKISLWGSERLSLSEVELAYLSLLTEHFCCIFGFVPNKSSNLGINFAIYSVGLHVSWKYRSVSKYRFIFESPKLESFRGSWKDLVEVGNFS